MSTPRDAHHLGHSAGAPAGAMSAQHVGGHGQAMLTVPTGSLACEACVGCVEERLRENPHVTDVHVDVRHEVAHVTVHQGMVTGDELAEMIADACGDRNTVPLPKPQVSSHAHAHTSRPAKVDGHAGHGVASAAAEVDYAAMDHGGHGGHGMSDLRMAAAKEADMRRRFWTSLVLAIPVVLYSPMAMMVGLELPTPFGIPHDWIMLLFSKPIFRARSRLLVPKRAQQAS